MSYQLPESFSLYPFGWTRRWPPADSESKWLAKENPQTYPIAIKLETASHVAELFSWVSLPSCSLPGRPFPIKSLALSAHVSPRTIHFRVLDKSPFSGPGRGPPSCNNTFAYSTTNIYCVLPLASHFWKHSIQQKTKQINKTFSSLGFEKKKAILLFAWSQKWSTSRVNSGT